MYARDVFISHTWDDKSTHARPLNDALRRRGVSTWIDEAQLNEGDNIVQKIAWGLDRAAIVVFLITEGFLGHRWAEKELTAALSKEIAAGTARVIAIVDIDDIEKVFHRFPLLRDKLYVRWQIGIEEVADRLSRRFPRPVGNWHMFYHPADYTGVIWTRIIPSSNQTDSAHRVTILWGPYRFTGEFQAISQTPMSLIHHKIEADSLPIYVHVEPAAIITVGQGPAPDPDQINIDEGWVRLSGADVAR